MRSGRPRSIASFKLANDLRQTGVAYHTIIDGGANVGQFARAIHTAFPAATIISFEPLPDVAETLRHNLREVPNHHVIESALGDRNGSTTFYRHDYSQSSSVLPTQDWDQSNHPQQSQRLDVPLTRIDDALAPINFQPPVLMKLDLQGYELTALRGAPQTLARCDTLLIETVFQQAYQGEPLFCEIQAFLRGHGFAFSRPLNFMRGQAGQIVQMDALFERRSDCSA